MATPRARVITFTPAPSLDRTYSLPALALGAVHRAQRVTAEFAGKGVNVQLALALGAIDSLAVVPLNEAEMSLVGTNPSIVASGIEAPVRVSITILEDNGRTTKINAQPPSLSPTEWASLSATLTALVEEHKPSWCLVAGTIPRHIDGSEIPLWPLLDAIASSGTLVALDTSGDALRKLSETGLPDFIKPNAEELAQCVGRDLSHLGDIIEAAREVSAWGVTNVMVSLGPDGILGVRGDEVVRASTGPITVRSWVSSSPQRRRSWCRGSFSNSRRLTPPRRSLTRPRSAAKR